MRAQELILPQKLYCLKNRSILRKIKKKGEGRDRTKRDKWKGRESKAKQNRRRKKEDIITSEPLVVYVYVLLNKKNLWTTSQDWVPSPFRCIYGWMSCEGLRYMGLCTYIHTYIHTYMNPVPCFASLGRLCPAETSIRSSLFLHVQQKSNVSLWASIYEATIFSCLLLGHPMESRNHRFISSCVCYVVSAWSYINLGQSVRSQSPLKNGNNRFSS